VLISSLTYSSAVKIEATRFSETSIDFQWTALRYIQEDTFRLQGMFTAYLVLNFN
jgi:hypothetical protein